MEEKEYLTVQEFAERAGCTKQRVYQLLNKSLKPFTVVENGRKYVLSDGIEEVLKAREAQGFSSKLPTVEQELSKGLMQDETLKLELDELKARLEQAVADLAAKDEQIKDAEIKAAAADAERKRADAAEQNVKVRDEQLIAQQKTIESLTNALASAQEAQTRLTEALAAEQALHAGTIQKQLTMQDEKPKGFLGRLFGKKKKENNDGISD